MLKHVLLFTTNVARMFVTVILLLNYENQTLTKQGEHKQTQKGQKQRVNKQGSGLVCKHVPFESQGPKGGVRMKRQKKQEEGNPDPLL